MIACDICGNEAFLQNDEGEKRCFGCYCDMVESWYEIDKEIEQ